ncbi:MAG: 1-(5-phosphoribosyl)-5-[(5-phosphoribosylamino)methylideneamino]imidazole-4-carboxamide isomerase [Deltaproteobacteria bacterium]|nr:MAG: 1-(5-phosphoribosyl)-5-[(5-phosphoribosylamino)methylideneamino]imidazole-4-carboxamide isomerase [Deltaproteobacteria bacterium]
MILYPAIDIFNGQCVRLKQGKFDDATIYYKNPVDAAKKWVDQGAKWLHVVDLNGAREGKPANIKVIEEIMTSLNVPVQIGGGIRSQDIAEIYLTMGAGRVVIGSAAFEDPDLMQILCAKFEGRVALGLDAKDGKVAVHGWEDTLEKEAIAVAHEFESLGLQHLIYTDISRDGMMTGPNFDGMKKMIDATMVPVIASGGISTIEDLIKLKELGASGAILGKSIYEGKIDLKEALEKVSS